MEGRLFTFLGTIGGHGQEWIILSHFVLVIGIIFLVSRMATRKMQLVPTRKPKCYGSICRWCYCYG